MADPITASPNTIETVLQLVERLGVPTALVVFLGWIVLKMTGVKTTPGAQSTGGEERWSRMETRIVHLEDRVWEMMRILVVPGVRQPTHHYMDHLLDKLRLKRPMRIEELEDLQQLLEQRLEEPEPPGEPGYHMKVMLTLSLVRQDAQTAREEAERLQQNLVLERKHADAQRWTDRLRKWIPW